MPSRIPTRALVNNNHSLSSSDEESAGESNTAWLFRRCADLTPSLSIAINIAQNIFIGIEEINEKNKKCEDVDPQLIFFEAMKNYWVMSFIFDLVERMDDLVSDETLMDEALANEFLESDRESIPFGNEDNDEDENDLDLDQILAVQRRLGQGAGCKDCEFGDFERG